MQEFGENSSVNDLLDWWVFRFAHDLTDGCESGEVGRLGEVGAEAGLDRGEIVDGGNDLVRGLGFRGRIVIGEEVIDHHSTFTHHVFSFLRMGRVRGNWVGAAEEG